jgi:predicted kinase
LIVGKDVPTHGGGDQNYIRRNVMEYAATKPQHLTKTNVPSGGEGSLWFRVTHHEVEEDPGGEAAEPQTTTKKKKKKKKKKPATYDDARAALSELPSAVNHVVIIMRGPPGCGKSKLAGEIGDYLMGNRKFEQVKIVSADDYFMHDQVYMWDREKLGYAHRAARSKAERFMDTMCGDSKRALIVDNTNMKVTDMRPYEAMANKKGVHVMYVEPPFWKAALLNQESPPDKFGTWGEYFTHKNQHDVPLDAIRRSMDAYAKNPTDRPTGGRRRK